MNYPTILFDLDGTLLDTLDDLQAACNAALHAVGAPPRTLEEVRTFVGNGLGKLMERALPDGRTNPRFDEALEHLKSYYSTHMKVRTAPYPGILDLLQALKSQGRHLGVVSNKIQPAVTDLCDTFFPGLLDVAIGERPGIRRKPAPDTVLEALRQMNMPPEGAIYVGDSDVDLATARAAGLPCISATWGFRSRDDLLAAGAQLFAHTPADILRLLATPS